VSASYQPKIFANYFEPPPVASKYMKSQQITGTPLTVCWGKKKTSQWGKKEESIVKGKIKVRYTARDKTSSICFSDKQGNGNYSWEKKHILLYLSVRADQSHLE